MPEFDNPPPPAAGVAALEHWAVRFARGVVLFLHHSLARIGLSPALPISILEASSSGLRGAYADGEVQ